ncbi:hypothetical protein WJX81_003509 [Elliptochloris bilobata]|uniref:Sugar phosphate transporter domain-containing protein n=1 Tax=Elliptochloris bilobata TaxID=381761 RepID=A0AAW1RVD8_9CHLO
MDLYTPFLILSWYASNIGVLLLNKLLLTSYGFKYPIFLTMCHMLSCTFMGYAFSRFSSVPAKSVRGGVVLTKIAVLATVFCLSVVLGNASLRFIPVSFNQAIGATTPFFTALLGLVMLRDRETWLVYGSLVPVVIGIVVASGGEPLFHLIGFLACVGATAARAFKSVLQSVLMSHSTEKLDSMSLLLYMAPIAATLLLPFTVVLEGNVVRHVTVLAADEPWFLAVLGLNSFLAFFVNLTNFLVTKHTSALTLQVLGNAKGVVAATISVLLFHNPVTAMSMAGYGITVCGVVCYSQAKKVGKVQKLNGESLPLTDSSNLPTVGSLSKGPYGTGRIRGLSSE